MLANAPASDRTDQFYVYLLGSGHIAICNQQGECIASTDLGKVGTKVLDTKKINNGMETSSISLGNDLNAFLVTDGEPLTMAENDLNYIKNLAEFALKQYLKANSNSEDSTDRFFTRLINSRLDPETIYRFELEARSLGFSLGLQRTAIVIDFDKFDYNLLHDVHYSLEPNETIQEMKRRIINAINGFFTKNSNLTVAYIGNGKFLVLKVIGDLEEQNFIRLIKKAHKTIFDSLKDDEHGKMTVGFGNARGGLLGVVEAFEEGDRALELGKKLGKGKEESFYYGDFHELRILTEENNHKKVSYANELVGLLNDNLGLKQTLEIFFEEDLSITNTAQKLKLHPNTVIYRLKRIKDIIGFDPRVFDEATAIKIALLTNKLLA